MKPSLIIATAILALAPAAAAAQDRQRFSGRFTTSQPAAPTGLSEAIDYANPSDPDGKPHSVQTVVLRLHPGAVIDTTVPEQCQATEADFAERGPAACPPGSRVGSGELTIDFGGGNVVEFVSTFFNDRDQIILYLESTNTPTRITSSSRGSARDGAFTTQVPPLPGQPPPDSFAAIERVRIELDRVTRGGRAYLTTPPACPAGGAWTNTGTFTYRDGVTQTVGSASPCSPPDRTRPSIAVRGVPSRCPGRSFVTRVRIADSSPLRRAAVFVDGRRVRTTKRKLFSQRVKPRRGLTVVAVDAAGNRTARRLRC